MENIQWIGGLGPFVRIAKKWYVIENWEHREEAPHQNRDIRLRLLTGDERELLRRHLADCIMELYERIAT